MSLQKTWNNNPKVKNVTNRFTAVLFIIYLIVLCWILLLKLGVRFSYMTTRRVNLIPFKEAVIVNGKMDVPETLLNVIIFVPLGIYAAILFGRWSFVKKLFFFFLLSLLIEALQYILAIGSFDITDIITNTSGGIIGLLLFKAIEKIFNDTAKATEVVNTIAAMGTVIIIVFLLLLKLDMLPIRYR